jgi:hypothetical protein
LTFCLKYEKTGRFILCILSLSLGPLGEPGIGFRLTVGTGEVRRCHVEVEGEVEGED